MSGPEHDCARCGKVLTEHIQTVPCGSNCRECGRYGYLPGQPSYLYLLTNPELAQHRIGIGSVGRDKDRLQQLISEGWLVHGLWHDEDKRRTFQWEREVFKQLQKRFGATEPQTPNLAGKSDKHWVETVSAQAISVSELSNLISEIISKFKSATV